MGVVVICSYNPKDGKDAELEDLLRRHQPVLREAGLITDRQATFLKSEEGVYVEIFEWTSEEAARSAEGNTAVQEIWGAMASVADFVPMASIAQSQSPFAHFGPLDL